MRWDTQATICAIATGNVGATRGAIRIAGPETVSILKSIIRSTFDLNVDLIGGGKAATRSTILFPLGPPFGSLDVALWLWPTKRSYTGSPAAELHMIGNQVLLNRALQVLASHGAKIAEPGEFTLRAFLSGRMDLTQCEAVLGAINATNDRQFEVALHQLAGGLSQPLGLIRQSLIELLADLEAGLDFVDEDISFISEEEVVRRIEIAEECINALLLQLSQRSGSPKNLEVVLTGSPNAGKSSLVNALTKSSLAIVNSQAGTTRDYLRATLQHDGRTIDLIDTAGLMPTMGDHDEMNVHNIENLAMEMTVSQRQSARLVLYSIDSMLDQDEIQRELASFDSLKKQQPNTWLVWTKCESPGCSEALAKLTNSKTVFQTSSKQSFGLKELIDAILRWQEAEEAESTMVVGATGTRCIGSLQEASTALLNARNAFQQGGDEIVAGELRLALDAIGAVAGEVYTDDVLDALFSRFCIGK